MTFSNLFRGWPKDRLFTVHSDKIPLSHDVCEHEYQLGPEEISLWGPLEELRRLLRGDRSGDGVTTRVASQVDAVERGEPTVGALRRYARQAMGLVFGNAGPPMVAHLSPRLEAWIAKARPEVLYTILGSTEMIDLVNKIASRFDLPVVIHIMDDWRSERSRGGFMSPFLRARLLHRFDASVRSATGHLAISEAMSKAYECEYGVGFEAVQNVIDTADWLADSRNDLMPSSPARVLYAGSLYPEVQLESLLDAATAVARLRASGTNITLDVMSPQFMVAPYRDRLLAHDGVRVVAQVQRSDYFRTICAADLLLLPANFTKSTIRFIRYSMPTKIPEYLVSGVPVILYGPAGTAQMDYAIDAGWGLTVTRRDVSALADALKRGVTDINLRRALVSRGQKIAAERHDANVVRGRFQAMLIRAATVDRSIVKGTLPV